MNWAELKKQTKINTKIGFAIGVLQYLELLDDINVNKEAITEAKEKLEEAVELTNN